MGESPLRTSEQGLLYDRRWFGADVRHPLHLTLVFASVDLPNVALREQPRIAFRVRASLKRNTCVPAEDESMKHATGAFSILKKKHENNKETSHAQTLRSCRNPGFKLLDTSHPALLCHQAPFSDAKDGPGGYSILTSVIHSPVDPAPRDHSRKPG